jgi:hypothetical protein
VVLLSQQDVGNRSRSNNILINKSAFVPGDRFVRGYSVEFNRMTPSLGTCLGAREHALNAMTTARRRHPRKQAVPAPDPCTQWQLWAKKISAAFQKGVTSIIETGQLLNEAKEVLEHGSFESMVQSKLPFTPRTAEMFMQIAKHPVISNPKHVSLLPPSWGTLYQITRLPLQLVRECIEDKRITPKNPAQGRHRTWGEAAEKGSPRRRGYSKGARKKTHQRRSTRPAATSCSR